MVPPDPLVSLCWYDLPEVGAATNAFWRGVRERLEVAGLGDLPAVPHRDGDVDVIWRSRRLLLGQACGFDAVVAYPRQLRVVATPCYRTPYSDGPTHRSLIVAREKTSFSVVDDLRGARCVINNETSHSGMNVWQAVAAERHVDGRFFSEVQVSGSHVESLAALRAGRADVAAIDCITHALVTRDRPMALEGTRILFTSPLAPVPPFVTFADASDELVDLLRDALEGVMADESFADTRRRLLLTGCEVLPPEAYEEIARIDGRARALGYREFGEVRRGATTPTSPSSAP